MATIYWTRDEEASLSAYLKSKDTPEWYDVYIDALDTHCPYEDMQQWYPDFYRALYTLDFEKLPLEINDTHPHVIAWRLSQGK